MSDDLVKRLERTVDEIMSIETPAMGGDNLAIVLCGNFDDGDETTADETGWSQAARDGYEEVRAAIRQRFSPIAARITALEAENKRLREEKEFAWDSGAHAALGLVGFEGWFGRLKNPYTAALEKK